jgi:hypothetical protein
VKDQFVTVYKVFLEKKINVFIYERIVMDGMFVMLMDLGRLIVV